VGNQKSHTPTPPASALEREEERKYFRGNVVFGALVGKPWLLVFLRRLESCEKKSAHKRNPPGLTKEPRKP
jgi:hypothetical protein